MRSGQGVFLLLPRHKAQHECRAPGSILLCMGLFSRFLFRRPCAANDQGSGRDCSFATSAADLAAAPYTKAPPIVAAAYDWSGFYVGADGGWGSSRVCWDFTTPSGSFLGAGGCHDATGGVVGAQVGYRWQSGSWVFGLEAQGGWADLRGSNRSLVSPAFVNNTKLDAFALFTGQAGYAWNNVLLYVKGGGAITDNKFTGASFLTGAPLDSSSDTRGGGTAGIGLEYGFATNWSVAVEYDHLFMADHRDTFTRTTGLFSRTDNIHQDADLVTARVNYHFGGPVVAKY